MRTLFLLLCLCFSASAQLNITKPFYVSGLLKPAAAGGGGGYSTPADIAGLQIWIDPDTITASDGQAFAVLIESSGNGHIFGQATSGSRPVFTNSTAALNNKHSIYFDGVNDWMTNMSYTTSGVNYTYYGVFKLNVDYNGFADAYILDGSGGTMSIRAIDAGSFKFTIYDGTLQRSFDGIPTATAAQIVCAVMNSTGTSLQVYTNGVAAGAAQAWNQPGVNTFTLGAIVAHSGGFLGAVIGDQILYEGAHDATQRQNNTRYLGTKYNITVP